MSLPIGTINDQPIYKNKRNNKKVLTIIVGVLITVIITIGTTYAAIMIKSGVNKISPVESKQANTADKTKEDNKTEDKNENSGITTETAKLTSATEEKAALAKAVHPGDPSDTSKPFNVLVLGIDRRSGDQTHWRTDVIQLVTISNNRSKVLITHIPRDVWAGSYKINALYNLQGPEIMKDKVQEITGQRPDRIVRFDFDAFVWAVDAVGGVTVDVEKTFTDTQYPDDRNGTEEIKTIKFEAGKKVMDGEEALTYVRSRKGDNGEGSDYARGRRQQIIMKSIVADYFKLDNIFNPKTPENLYTLATQKIYTDFTLTDAKVLFDVAKNYKNITVSHLSLDTSNYLVVPSDSTPYGGAWTLVAKDGSYAPIHNEINSSIQ